MKSFLSEEETEELESLKQDLVGPVKRFFAEVREDSVGDAKRYYSAKARKAQQDVRLAQKRAAERLNAVRQEQEALRRRRKAMMKRASIILALLALFSLIVISAALSAHAETPVFEQTILMQKEHASNDARSFFRIQYPLSPKTFIARQRSQ